MLLFAGLPFVLAAVVSTALLRRIKRKDQKVRGEEGKKANVIARWAKDNKLSLSFGAAFLSMLLIAAVAGFICIKLSASVQIYYIICGIAMGAVAGVALAVVMPPKE